MQAGPSRLTPVVVSHCRQPRAVDRHCGGELLVLGRRAVIGQVAGDDNRVRSRAGGLADDAVQTLQTLPAAVQVGVAEVSDDRHAIP